MKTYKTERVSKTEIQKTIASEDPTRIFAMYRRVYGGEGEINKWNVFDFIKKYAPTKRLYDLARELSFLNGKRRDKGDLFREWRKDSQWRRANQRHEVMCYLRRQMHDPITTYTKMPLIAGGWLLFCSPWYGAKDYNRWDVMEVAEDEEFCRKVCSVGERFWRTNTRPLSNSRGR